MDRAQARQLYLSMDDKDFDDLARQMTSWQIKYWTVITLTFLTGVIIGIAVTKGVF